MFLQPARSVVPSFDPQRCGTGFRPDRDPLRNNLLEGLRQLNIHHANQAAIVTSTQQHRASRKDARFFIWIIPALPLYYVAQVDQAPAQELILSVGRDDGIFGMAEGRDVVRRSEVLDPIPLAAET